MSRSRIPDCATSTDRSTDARMSGSLVDTDAWLEPGRAALTRPRRPAMSVATASRASGRNPFTSGIARHRASSGSLSGPAAISASATTSGPRVVNQPLVSVALEHQRVAQPVRVGGVGAPGAGDHDVDDPARVQPVREGQRVAGLDAHDPGGRLGQRGLDRRPARLRPAAVDELAVPLDALERGRLHEVRHRRRVRGGVRVGRRLEDLRDLAAGGGQARLELGHDRVVDGVEALGQDVGADHDRAVGRRGRQQLAVQAGERHRVRVQRPRGEQRQRARQQRPRRDHDGQVRAAPSEHGGPEAERCGQRTFSRRGRGGRHPDNNPRRTGKVPRPSIGPHAVGTLRRHQEEPVTVAAVILAASPTRRSPMRTGRPASGGSPTSRGRAGRRPSSCARSIPRARSRPRWPTPRRRSSIRSRRNAGRSPRS